MRGIILLCILLIGLTACGEPVDDFDGYNLTGSVKENFPDQQRILIESSIDRDMFIDISDQTELVGFEFEDFEIGDSLKIYNPNPIEDLEPTSATAGRIAKEN